MKLTNKPKLILVLYSFIFNNIKYIITINITKKYYIGLIFALAIIIHVVSLMDVF